MFRLALYGIIFLLVAISIILVLVVSVMRARARAARVEKLQEEISALENLAAPSQQQISKKAEQMQVEEAAKAEEADPFAPSIL